MKRLGPQRSHSEMRLLGNVKPEDASGGLGLRGPRAPAYRPAVTWSGSGQDVHGGRVAPTLSVPVPRVRVDAHPDSEPFVQRGPRRLAPAGTAEGRAGPPPQPPAGRKAGHGAPWAAACRGARLPRGGSWGPAGRHSASGARGAGVRGVHRQVFQLMFPSGLRDGAGGGLPRGVSRRQGRGRLETRAAALQHLTRLSP